MQPVTQSLSAGASQAAGTPTHAVDLGSRTTKSATSRSAARPATTQPVTKVTVAKLTTTDKKSTPGSRWTTTTLRLRAEPSETAKVIGKVEPGTKLSTTGVSTAGWSQIEWQKDIAWVSAEYLTEENQTTSDPVQPASAADNSSDGDDSAPVATGNGCRRQLPGLTSRARRLHNAICSNFPSISSYGGVRPDAYPAHPEGRAIDAMTRGATGDALANWLRANASQYGIEEIIWSQRIWTAQRSGEGWRSMSDRGSATANHYDHVHVAVKRG